MEVGKGSRFVGGIARKGGKSVAVDLMPCFVLKAAFHDN